MDRGSLDPGRADMQPLSWPFQLADGIVGQANQTTLPHENPAGRVSALPIARLQHISASVCLLRLLASFFSLSRPWLVYRVSNFIWLVDFYPLTGLRQVT